jgi:hypothetical protein
MSGEEYRFKMKPAWDTFALDDDPNRLRVSVAAVLLQGEDLWVNVDHAGRRPEGRLGTRSDSGYSHPPYPSEVAPSTPATADQSEPRHRVTAKTVGAAACVGNTCPVMIIKQIGETIGLTIVFEKSAQASGDFYLLNLRYGDIIEIMLCLNHLKYTRTGNHLTVKPDAFPESFHRLILAN